MQYRIEGMDYISCVGKIETALARMPGVYDIYLNFATEKLELTLSSDTAIQASDIEKTIESLGFGISNSLDASSSADNDSNLQLVSRQWWQTQSGSLILFTRCLRFGRVTMLV